MNRKIEQLWHVRKAGGYGMSPAWLPHRVWLMLLLPLFLDGEVFSADRQPLAVDRSAIQREAVASAEKFVDASIRCAGLEAGNELLESEIERLKAFDKGDSAGAELLGKLALVDAEMRRTLGDILQENADPLVLGAEGSLERMAEQTARARGAWLETRAALNRTELLLFEIRGSGRVAAQLASLLSVDKRWFWLCGMVAVGTLLAVVCHDRRHEFRKMLNGGRPKALGLSKVLAILLALLACATLTTFLNGDRIYQALLTAGEGDEASPRNRVRQQNAALETRLTELEARRRELTTAHAGLQQSWRERLVMGLPARNRLPERWQQLRQSVLTARENLAGLEVIRDGLNADRAELARNGEQLRSQEAETRWYLSVRRWIRGLLGLALVGLTALGGMWYWGGVTQRTRVTADTCPLCLGRGSLQTEGSDPAAGDDLDVVRCSNVVSREPYEECDFSFKAAYRAMSKLCFPTLGIPQAGKTHWLAMLYWGLNQGNYPKTVEFERVRSQSSESFDRIVEEILYSRIGTAATQQARIPYPLVFNFRDHDPLGSSNLLVNIFDYSGEVTSEMDATDYRRRRALEGDGFLFFLDPTYPSEVQAKALADFREDLRLIKGVKAGRRLRTPVALCISKIDLLAGHDYRLPDGSDAIARFYEDLSRIDPSGESTRRSVLEERSRLTSRLRTVIWPDWQVERQIGDLFGGRYAFFPLTPVGLDGRGEADLTLRTISPFGLLEPLLWLLQMTGHPVLQ